MLNHGSTPCHWPSPSAMELLPLTSNADPPCYKIAFSYPKLIEKSPTLLYQERHRLLINIVSLPTKYCFEKSKMLLWKKASHVFGGMMKTQTGLLNCNHSWQVHVVNDRYFQKLHHLKPKASHINFHYTVHISCLDILAGIQAPLILWW